MTALRRRTPSLRADARRTALCLLASLFLSAGVFAADRKPEPVPMPKEEALRLGERIYREGILPSGEPVMAIVQEDIPVDGTMFSCTSCHMRGGLGSNEGRISTLPTNGDSLYRPYEDTPVPMTTVEKNFKKFRAAHRRPAYTDETLAEAIRLGTDPAGRRLDPTMPCYQMNDRDMAILVSYLKVLSSETPPGVTPTNIRFATVIAGDVAPEDRDAMILPLEAYVRERNSRSRGLQRRVRMRASMEGLNLALRDVSLARWELRGPPGTWRAQLEEYYRKEPVFAMLGGIGYGDWRPVHDFCENHRIPCVFPITDFPVISESDWYTIYLSKGIYQEGEAAARYLRREVERVPETTIVHVYRDTPGGRALAAGFEETWREMGLPSPECRVLRGDEPVTGKLLRSLPAKGAHAVLLLWAGPEAAQALEEIAADPARPGKVFLSYSLWKRNPGTVPDKARDYTFLTYPYRLPREEGPYGNMARAWLAAKKVPLNDRRIATRTYSLIGVMSQAFGKMRQNIYRDNFIDSISVLPDLLYPDYERLSFGPGQRYASKGCYIVQLTHGAVPEIVKKSDWVIH